MRVSGGNGNLCSIPIGRIHLHNVVLSDEHSESDCTALIKYAAYFSVQYITMNWLLRLGAYFISFFWGKRNQNLRNYL